MKPLDYLNLCYIWAKSYPSRSRIWRGESTGSGIRVSYGHNRVPGFDEHVFGGLVKLQDLNREFPHSTVNPNLLYLVSSALPYFPVQLAEMAKRRGAKIVVNQNGVAYPGWYGKGYERENRAMSRLHSIADYVFYQSSFCKISAEKFLGKRTTGMCSEILYNPVDTTIFRPLTEKNLNETANIILLAGSHWTTYRVYKAIETLKIVSETKSDVVLNIAGRFCWDDNPKKAEQEVYDHADKLGVREKVFYSGPYSQEEAPGIFNSCSVLLHTKYNDPCPRLVVEAMACGLPIVYSATGGVPELVGDEAGEGVNGPLDWDRDHPPAPEELAGCVLRVMSDLPAYSRAARERAALHFDAESWISRHRTVFNELVANEHIKY